MLFSCRTVAGKRITFVATIKTRPGVLSNLRCHVPFKKWYAVSTSIHKLNHRSFIIVKPQVHFHSWIIECSRLPEHIYFTSLIPTHNLRQHCKHRPMRANFHLPSSFIPTTRVYATERSSKVSALLFSRLHRHVLPPYSLLVVAWTKTSASVSDSRSDFDSYRVHKFIVRSRLYWLKRRLQP